MFTLQWLGMASQSGIQPVLHRSMIQSNDVRAAIVRAKDELKKKETFAKGQTYAVRVLDNESVLVWTGTIHDV
jgi:hypothetical protein